MVFSKGTGYGIRALAYLARQSEGRSYGIGEIAASEKIPSEYLRKLLSELRRHRLVSSVKGIHGGYMLARPAESITLWDVFSLLDQDPYLDECIICGSREAGRSCPICREWQQISDGLVNLLKCQTIADFANFAPDGQKEGRQAEHIKL